MNFIKLNKLRQISRKTIIIFLIGLALIISHFTIFNGRPSIQRILPFYFGYAVCVWAYERVKFEIKYGKIS